MGRFHDETSLVGSVARDRARLRTGFCPRSHSGTSEDVHAVESTRSSTQGSSTSDELEQFADRISCGDSGLSVRNASLPHRQKAEPLEEEPVRRNVPQTAWKGSYFSGTYMELRDAPMPGVP